MKTKCQICKHGAENTYKTAIKKMNNKIITIEYKEGNLGCKKSENNIRQEECLNNNFNKFEE